MVELKLEALDFETLSPNDTYVAVRVGESQKLSRLSAVRNFKFPKNVVGDRKYGKVDVFKRVGTGSVSIRNDGDSASQELALDCQGANMKFRVTLGGDTVPSDKPAKEAGPAVAEAKNYLMQHNLEMVLAECMQAVLRERPANPTAFIANKLNQSQGNYRRTPGRAEAAMFAPGGKVPADLLDMNPIVSSPMAECARNLYGMFPQAGGGSPASGGIKSVRTKAPIHVLNFNPEFSTPVSAASRKLYALFPQAKRVEQKKPSNAVEDLRNSAKATLLGAVKDGALDKALANSRSGKASGNDAELKQQARMKMLEAASAGTLDKALADIKGETKAADAAGKVRAEQAKDILKQAAESGKLGEALVGVAGVAKK